MTPEERKTCEEIHATIKKLDKMFIELGLDNIE